MLRFINRLTMIAFFHDVYQYPETPRRQFRVKSIGALKIHTISFFLRADTYKIEEI